MSIQRNRTQINNLLLAPGFDLEITADAKDFTTIIATQKFNGVGQYANRYKRITDSINLSKKDKTPWYDIAEWNDFINYIKRDKKTRDSIASIVFSTSTIKEPYYKDFYQMILLNNDLMNFYQTLTFTALKFKSADSAIMLVKQQYDIDKKLKYDSLSLRSDYFRNWLITSEYLAFLLRQDYQKDPTLKNDRWYRFKKVSELYSGKVKEFALYEMVSAYLYGAKTIQGLNKEKEKLSPYIDMIKNTTYLNEINKVYANKEKEIERTQIGKQAPGFTLQSNKETTHSLSDYLGKVVYIDLWASWCKPCREETPYMRELYQKYVANPAVQIIGIAVSDAKNEWLKAIQEDRPEWLQLIDTDRLVNNAYVANAIPKFILIDKKGNIVAFDAPRPSDKDRLYQMIETEISK